MAFELHLQGVVELTEAERAAAPDLRVPKEARAEGVLLVEGTYIGGDPSHFITRESIRAVIAKYAHHVPWIEDLVERERDGRLCLVAIFKPGVVPAGDGVRLSPHYTE